MNINLKNLIEAFKSSKGVKFISFPYENQQGELARRLVNIGISYENAKKKDLETLREGIDVIQSDKYSLTDWNLAKAELEASLVKPDEVRSEAQTNAYIKLDENGSLKYNVEQQALYIFGSSVNKSVEVEGVYKEVKSAPKTIAKNAIKKHYLRTGQLRTFKVTNLKGGIKMNGDTIEID
jgi:uncharacterized protein (DUF1015 family)